jgi:hypothetical protein
VVQAAAGDMHAAAIPAAVLHACCCCFRLSVHQCCTCTSWCSLADSSRPQQLHTQHTPLKLACCHSCHCSRCCYCCCCCYCCGCC